MTVFFCALAFKSANCEEHRDHNNIVGAFNIMPENIAVAHQDGIKYAFIYGMPPSIDSPLRKERSFARALLNSDIKVVTAEITRYVREWECHRTWTIAKPPLFKRNGYCETDISPNMDDTHLLNKVKQVVAATQSNPLVVGYWVRDDMPAWDEGNYGNMLRRIAKLLPTDKFTVCGFGAPLLPKGERGSIANLSESGWIPEQAKDYSVQGCNYVGLYIYAARAKISENNSNRYDWSMKKNLDYVLADLQLNGWTPQKSPLIGVVQAWAGRLPDHPEIGEVLPSKESIRIQSAAFCRRGAKGIVFYAYHLSAYLDPQTPTNNPGIESGVQAGISACKAVWSEDP